MDIKIIATAHPFYQQILDLRDRILRKPLGHSVYNDDLSDEPNQVILAGIADEKVIACCILKAIAPGTMKLRQMAVEQGLQGKGIGNQILKAAEIYATQNGINRIELHARKYALPFYEKAGYTKEGTEFTEVGIPHFAMKKDLG